MATTADNANLAVALTRLEGLAGDMADVKTVLRDLAGAVNRLAVIEERQTNSHQAVERAFRELARHEERIGLLELAHPINKHTNTTVNRVVAAVLGGVITAVLALVVTSGRAQLPPDRPRQPVINEVNRP